MRWRVEPASILSSCAVFSSGLLQQFGRQRDARLAAASNSMVISEQDRQANRYAHGLSEEDEPLLCGRDALLLLQLLLDLLRLCERPSVSVRLNTPEPIPSFPLAR